MAEKKIWGNIFNAAPEACFKEEIRNFIFNLPFEKASCKFRNYFRMYTVQTGKKVFISGDLVPLTTPGKSSDLPLSIG
jgi:hypothetical protein